MRALARLSLPLVFVLSLIASGCGPAVDLTTGLQVVDLTTGWFDAGMVNGQNKLVPSITFKFKNVSDQSLKALQANAVFRQVGGEDVEWGSGFDSVRGSEGLAPGETTAAITLRSLNGLTGAQPRAEMLSNAAFVDAKVQLFAKYGSASWTRLADRQVDRRLLTN